MADYIEVARLDEVPDYGVRTYPVKVVDRTIMIALVTPPAPAG